MPYYGDGAPYYYGAGPFSNHSSLMTGISRYHNPIAARYAPHLSTISESPIIKLRRYGPVSLSTTTTATLSRPRRIIDTSTIDVSKPPPSHSLESRQQRHRLRRDRPTIKIRSQALKDNPALREYTLKHEKTKGELLVEKFLIKEKQYDSDRMRLDNETGLMNDMAKDEQLDDSDHENDILAQIRRRVTRRMTRRRSSADVLPLNSEQIEREAALHVAQAEALDSLVAEEQAEIEDEVRKGTFARRPTMRKPIDMPEVSETEEDDEMDEEERKNDSLKKHVTTKKKKRKKVIDKPKSDDEDLDIPESVMEEVIEEEEFEWDDREKCDDIRAVLPAKDDVIEKKDKLKTVKNDLKAEEKKDKVVKPSEKVVPDEDKVKKARSAKSDEKMVKEDDKAKKIRAAKSEEKEKALKDEDRVKKTRTAKSEEKDTIKVEKDVAKKSVSPRVGRKEKLDKVATKVTETVDKEKTKEIKKEPEQPNRATLSPQRKEPAEPEDATPRFKVEACNSVGDMSTLYVKGAAATPEPTTHTIEQFRESIRLPAPRRVGAKEPDSVIETEIVLPVRRPYVRDTSRNSVYLALKPGKESGGGVAVSRPAKSDVAVADRSAPIERGDALTVKDDAAKIAVDKSVSKKPEPVVPVEPVKPKPVSDKKEFVAWWDDTPSATETNDKKKAEVAIPKKKVEPETKVEIVKTKVEAPKVEKKAETVSVNEKATSKVEVPKVDVAKVEKKVESVLVNEKLKSKVEIPKVDVGKVEKKAEAVAVDEKIKTKIQVPPKLDVVKKPAAKLSEKTIPEVKVLDESVKAVITETKEKPAIKIVDATEKVSKITSDKEVKAAEKSKPIVDAQKKLQPVPKSPSSEDDKEKKSSTARSKEELISRPNDRKLGGIKELPRIIENHLPNIPEEPKSPSPTEKPTKTFTKTNEPLTNRDKSPFRKEEQLKAKKAEPGTPNILASAAIATKEKDDRKKKVDAEAVMKIEKKILEDAESPHKIVSSAIPEPPALATLATVTTKKEKGEKQKVGLEKKSAKSAAGTEIDFWSEIKAQEEESAVTATMAVASGKVQSATDSQIDDITEAEGQEQRQPSLKLDLSRIGEAVDELKTPVVPDQEEQTTPLVADPQTPLSENLSQVPTQNLQLTQEQIPKEDDDAEISGTVKKISKWTNRDNLSNLNEADGDVTPVASKEVSPQGSATSSTTSTTKKKKIVKKKKSTTASKKKTDKADGSTKPSTKAKIPAKKTAPSPQTSLLKGPMSAMGSPRNTPSQRPADLVKLFYTTPPILLTATPRDLQKVRRAKVKRKKPTTRTPSLSSDSTGSTRSTATTSTEEGSNCEEDAEHKRLASTRSNDSGFDGSPRLSNCDMVCHKKCEKLTGNLCGLNQKLVAEALQALKKAPSQSENQRNADGDHFHQSGRITPPATNLPRFKKYEVTDFNFLKVLGKGSFGKVLLAELRGTEYVYAVKCLKKDVVLEDDDVECTLIERKVLTLATRHPYLCHLFCTFQTESHLFFVMEYLNGGDLMFHIQKSGRFTEARARFYAAEIWSGLIFLHKKGIVYRDLKLDNVLLDFEGHIRIADFGMCKLQIFLDRTADTFCGTPDYMAPEIIKGLKYNQAVDWWSYGVLLYEMLTGQSPFSGCDEDELFWSICNERPFIPRFLSQSATEIIVSLLEKDSGKRIPGHQIACHTFFCTIAWDKLERRTLEPPFKPAVEHTLDTRYFDEAFTTERPRLTPVPEQILTSMDQAVFRGFSYTNPNATD